MHSDIRQRLEELAAGLVLGNLEAEELQELQQALAAQCIDIEDLVALIRVEARIREDGQPLTVAPPARLRPQILAAAAREGRACGHADRLGRSQKPAFWPLALGGCAIASAIAVVADNALLRQQLARVNQQRELWEQVATQSNRSEPAVAAAADAPSLPLTLVATTQQVFDDHRDALQRDRGPADFPSSHLDAVWEHFRSAGVLSSPPPALAATEAELIGGSPCWFKAARGVRFSYLLEEEKAISLYQLSPLAAANLTGQTGPVYVNAADGTNLILWGDGNVLYAIVGNLSFPALEQLASISI